ncbi:MAG TPA: hypothetical protein VHT04_02855 [Stellaceae bacterium]|nr:hypothetical protein [Stellaceae bacterium]
MDAAVGRRAEFTPMMPSQARQREPHRLDAASQWAVQRFFVKLAAVGIFAGTLVNRPPLASILMLASANVLTSVMIAMLHRENYNADSLNHWDEAMAFTGLCALAHALKGTMGWG